MGLTGLEIFKQLPKKNCGECGVPTCLAFAMNLANGKATLDSCPYVTEEAKANLESASAPPIKLVKIGSGSNVLETGDETELYRHDKRFFHPAGIAVRVSDNEDVAAKVEKFKQLVFERVGMKYETDMMAVSCDSEDGEKFKSAVKAVYESIDNPMILIAENPAVMEKGLEAAADRKPLVYAATSDNYEEMTALAKKYGCPLAVRGDDLNDTAELVDKVVGLGYKELVIDNGARDTVKAMNNTVQMRRAAIKKKFRSFGYPNIMFTNKEKPDEEIIQAMVYLSKYASILVLNAFEPHQLLPLLTWRQNLYTDPQKPIQVEAKAYEIGDVSPDSPVYVTTNFSLTYFIVQGEVENSRIPAYIISVNTDGISVLTAYAAGKFTPESIANAIKDSGIEDKVNHKKIVIPGQVAVLKGKLEEASGWEVIVGPREAAGIPKFARANF